MFENANVGGDTMADILTHLFRLETNGQPMTVMQVAGLPVEAVDAVVCVVSRLAFDFGLWSDGAIPMLFVCEEAHRYAPADKNVGFAPTRRALMKIAKEGRKYGVYLGLVTQRAAELDPTIISQCNTLFAMRMANDRDQALLRSAVTDGVANLLAFVPSLGTREVVAVGEGLPLPARADLQSAARRSRAAQRNVRAQGIRGGRGTRARIRQAGGRALARRARRRRRRGSGACGEPRSSRSPPVRRRHALPSRDEPRAAVRQGRGVANRLEQLRSQISQTQRRRLRTSRP